VISTDRSAAATSSRSVNSASDATDRAPDPQQPSILVRDPPSIAIAITG
jgi:hypothetical protein